MAIDRDHVLNLFLELVRIDNPSGGEEGMARRVMEELRAMGLEPRRDEAGNVYAFLDGEGEPLLVNAHLDSVPVCVGKEPVVEDGVVRSRGETVLGADDLAGVAAMLAGARALLAEPRRRPLDLVFTVSEEIGLVGARQVRAEWLRARQGICLDGEGAFGDLTVSSPTRVGVTVTVRGRPAHAGVEPEKGIDALKIAARALADLPLGRIDAETTANFGKVQGGKAVNIVPAEVVLEGEVRSHDPEKLKAQLARMREAFQAAAREAGGEVEWEEAVSFVGQRFAADDPLVARVTAALARMGVTPTHRISGGGTDANALAEKGLRVLPVAVGYRDVHTPQESIAVADLERAARLVFELGRRA